MEVPDVAMGIHPGLHADGNYDDDDDDDYDYGDDNDDDEDDEMMI